MKLPVEGDLIQDLASVGFEAAVEIVEIDVRHTASRPIEDSRWVALRNRVVTLLFPTRNQVQLFALELVEKLWDLGRIVL